MKKLLLSLLLITSGMAYSFEPVSSKQNGEEEVFEPVLGRDYSLLENPLPTKQDGKVEVLEIFWYGCGHCYAMESKIKAWNKTTPEYVSFKKMPVTWGPVHRLHAATFYTIESIGSEQDLHAAVFSTMHNERNILSSEQAVSRFFGKVGVTSSELSKYLNSFGVKQRVNRAVELTKQLRVDSVPMIIVDGKYKVASRATALETVDYLVEMQKSES